MIEPTVLAYLAGIIDRGRWRMSEAVIRRPV